MQALCVAVHDVAPHTRPLCERLLRAIDAVAEIPVTLLVVPAYHRMPIADPVGYERFLAQRLSRGDELALHGYTHLDEGSAPRTLRERFQRHVFTLKEGEFSAMSASDARQRLEMGLAWFDRHRWPVQGFVAPAWLLSDGAWQALNDFPLRYTTTLSRLYLLPEKQALLAPSLFYSARNAWGRVLSRGWNSAFASLTCREQHGTLFNAVRHSPLNALPLVRVGLHPADANHPRLVAHFQRLLEKLLVKREPMTKAAFAKKMMEATRCK